MLKLNVKFEVNAAKAAQRDHEKQIKKAAARAINRAIDTAQTTAGRRISKATRIKVREVRAHMFVKGATPERLIAVLEALPYSPNLSRFNARENAKGVAATAWERRKTYKGAFILPRSQRVVTRTTRARTPLKGLRGPSVRATFMLDVIQKDIDDAARDRFIREFEREIARRTA